VAQFRRPPPDDGDRADVIRPEGAGFPIDVHVRRRSDAPGHAALNDMLESVSVLELDHLAEAVAGGREFRLPPLEELAVRDGWTVQPVGERWRLERDGTGSAHDVSRTDILLVLELTIRVALEPFEGEDDLPSWVVRSREVYPRVVDALGEEARFEPA
jgi:hypothetical protein